MRIFNFLKFMKVHFAYIQMRNNTNTHAPKHTHIHVFTQAYTVSIFMNQEDMMHEKI